jgi:hypothetical protein
MVFEIPVPGGRHKHEDQVARRSCTFAGIAKNPVDHEVTKSLYFENADGNGIEVYCPGLLYRDRIDF